MAITKLALFSLCSIFLIVLSIIAIRRYVHNEKIKNSIFIVMAIITVLLHYSGMFVHFYNGDFFIEDNLFLPVYPCNVMMWVNFVLIFLIGKKNKAFKVLAEFAFWCGTTCGLIGLCFNKNFLNDPYFSHYDSLKGLLSHATMIFCTVYLGFCGYIKIRTLDNLKSLLIGAVILIICSLGSDFILEQIGREPVNGMLLKPMEETPIANFYLISFAGLIIYLTISTIYEAIVYKEDVWYKTIRKREENNERSLN